MIVIGIYLIVLDILDAGSSLPSTTEDKKEPRLDRVKYFVKMIVEAIKSFIFLINIFWNGFVQNANFNGFL